MALQKSQDGAEFDFVGLSPGAYDLLVQTDRGEFAIKHKLVVELEREIMDLQIELRRGAVLQLSRPQRAEGGVDVEALQSGELVAWGWADRDGGNRTLVVPPGEVLLRIRNDATGAVEERTLLVSAGEALSVQLP